MGVSHLYLRSITLYQHLNPGSIPSYDTILYVLYVIQIDL